MYLEKIVLNNFRCFEKLEVNLDKMLTVVVGANGAGKTSLLEGMAIAISTMFTALDGVKGRGIDKSQAHLKAYAMGSTSDVQPQYPVTISADAVVDGRQVHWDRSLNTSTGQTTIKGAKDLVAVATDYHREKQTDIFKTNTRTNGYIDSVDGTANIKLMMNWFRNMTIQKYQNQENGFGAIPELEAVYAAMEKCYHLMTGSDDAKIQYNMGTTELDISYIDETGKRMRIPISQLSDGYKGTISLVADIAYRMAVLNPQCLGNVCDETDGIILIDEVDLHLHPAWQQRILGDLTSIFPKVQFIVTTHAPEVINSVQRENVIVIENNQAVSAPAETYGKDANGILRCIMRVKERPQIIIEKFELFYHLLDEKNFTMAEEILDDLENMVGEDPELSAMRVQLDMEQL